jgi:CheY-like chemotaxis protein
MDGPGGDARAAVARAREAKGGTVSVTYFCPHCMSNQLSYEYWQGSELMVRCLTCGYPVGDSGMPAAEAPGGKPRVLCIDDDQVILKMLQDSLQSHGFEVLTAPDGPQGLAAARRGLPHLILVDIMMPGLDGFEVCRRLRADAAFAETPLIILTAMDDPKLNVKGFQAGANLVLRKPFQPQKLVSTIQTALALKASKKRL